MPRAGSVLRTVCALIALAALSGCAVMKPTQTGFLDDYSELLPTGHHRSWGFGRHRVEVQHPEAGELDAIDSFYIEPIAWLAFEDDWLGQNDWRRESVTHAFEAALRWKLGWIKPIVKEPGPRTARVRAAITDVKATQAVTNLVVSSIAWVWVSNGGAAVEVEIVAPDGHRIAAVDGGSTGGILDYMGYYLWVSHSRTSVRRLADEVRDTLRSPEPKDVPSGEPVEESLDHGAARVGLGPGVAKP
jgi:hypothetical protein